MFLIHNLLDTTIMHTSSQTMSDQQQPFQSVVQESNVDLKRLKDLYQNQSRGFGTLLIVVGILAIVFNSVALGVFEYLSRWYHGFWMGAYVRVQLPCYHGPRR